MMFANRISSSTSCSIWLPETLPPTSARASPVTAFKVATLPSVKMTRLSCHRFRANEVRLWLSLIAYNLDNLWRRQILVSNTYSDPVDSPHSAAMLRGKSVR